MKDTDRIEKTTVLRAPQSRVWRALTDATQFGEWFRAKLDGPFVVGQTTRGRITHPGFEHLLMELQIEKIEPESAFSFRWHPYAVDQSIDYSKEAPTLVEFRLATVPEGTELTVVESGFDAIPEGRRAEAFRMNSQGWSAQLENVRRHVEA